jgi:hypothetical protein
LDLEPLARVVRATAIVDIRRLITGKTITITQTQNPFADLATINEMRRRCGLSNLYSAELRNHLCSIQFSASHGQGDRASTALLSDAATIDVQVFRVVCLASDLRHANEFVPRCSRSPGPLAQHWADEVPAAA